MHPLTLIVFLPMIAAVIAGLGGPWIGKTAAKVVTTGALFIGAILSWPIFFQYIAGGAQPTVVPVLEWIRSGDLDVAWALRLDALTAVMLVVVTTVSSLVHLYSWGYMEEDPSQPRFFAYLSLFSFAMLMLVTADNLVQMFFGWEGVGLASYLLIGFWYHKPSANAAALKAFIVNRIGDFGFSLAFSAPSWCSAPSLSRRSLPLLRALPDRRSACRDARRHHDLALPAAVRRSDGQVGAAPAAHLAAGRDGGPDAGQRTDPRGDDGNAGVFMVCRLSPDVRAIDDCNARRDLCRAATCIFAATVGCAQNDISG